MRSHYEWDPGERPVDRISVCAAELGAPCDPVDKSLAASGSTNKRDA